MSDINQYSGKPVAYPLSLVQLLLAGLCKMARGREGGRSRYLLLLSPTYLRLGTYLGRQMKMERKTAGHEYLDRWIPDNSQ
ncbi:hypothetical protein F4775DRAFT_576419 [Biscogniauxia sp. FL1348]|nr:hypothetical protein F4775DRAFT_576419 [Biscogniauxia sp. FL1348]